MRDRTTTYRRTLDYWKKVYRYRGKMKTQIDRLLFIKFIYNARRKSTVSQNEQRRGEQKDMKNKLEMQCSGIERKKVYGNRA